MPRPSRLSLELLETFVALSEHEGDATHAAEQLGVNQPSVSKRLAAIRRLTSERTGQAVVGPERETMASDSRGPTRARRW